MKNPLRNFQLPRLPKHVWKNIAAGVALLVAIIYLYMINDSNSPGLSSNLEDSTEDYQTQQNLQGSAAPATEDLNSASQLRAGDVLDNEFFSQHKSPNDRLEYHSRVLQNGLQVLLISDPESKKSAASLDVSRGSGDNPDEHLGIAHYLEHMLFLGTEKYPQADGFSEYVRASGGNYNAYTAYQNTNYFFDVQNNAFDEALDRFADFFIAPIFNPDFAERERDIVDSEFYTGLNNDGRRYYAVFQENMNPRHPMSKFTVGTKETLPGDAEQLISVLREFYDNNYRAPLMKLVLYSDRNIEQMIGLAEEYFSSIKGAQEQEIPSNKETDEPLFLSDNLPAIVQFQPVRQVYSLDYYFPIPPQLNNYASKPARFISNLLEQSGPGSLEDQLKQQGLINYFDTRLDVSLPEQALFRIYVSLSNKGNEQIEEISSMIFAALEEIRVQTQDEWRYQEMAQNAANRFEFRQKREAISYVRSLSRTMQLLPPENWLSSSLWQDYNPAKINEVLDALVPENMLLFWVHPDASTDREETYYKVPYSVERSVSLDEFVGSADLDLISPPPNRFVSDDIVLIENELDEAANPVRLDVSDINAWYKFNESFNLPEANLEVHLQSAAFDLGIKSAIYRTMMLEMMRDHISREAYQGDLADFSFSISNSKHGIDLSISGYNDKLELWVEEIINIIQNVEYEQEEFERTLEYVRRYVESIAKDSPLALLDNEFDILMLDYVHSEDEFFAEVENLSLAEMNQWQKNFFAKTRMVAFVYGNIEQEDALRLIDKLQLWNPQALEDQVLADSFADVHGKGRLIRQRNNLQGDSAALVYYQTEQIAKDDQAYHIRGMTSLMSRILQPQFFLQLRTEQSLGYIVQNYYSRLHNRPGVFFVVQSNHKAAGDLLMAVDDFIADSHDYLEAISEQEFNQYKDGLLNLLRKPPQNYSQDLRLYKEQIEEAAYEFDDLARAIAAIERITKQDIINHARQLLVADNSMALLTDDRNQNSASGEQGLSSDARLISSYEDFNQMIGQN